MFCFHQAFSNHAPYVQRGFFTSDWPADESEMQNISAAIYNCCLYVPFNQSKQSLVVLFLHAHFKRLKNCSFSRDPWDRFRSPQGHILRLLRGTKDDELHNRHCFRELNDTHFPLQQSVRKLAGRYAHLNSNSAVCVVFDSFQEYK